jgi:putative addiction module CopG family antidote
LVLYNRPMNDVILTPELETYATEAVAAGRYRDVSDIVQAGLRLLQRTDAARAELLASVLAAETEADRDGCSSLEHIETEMRAAICRAARPNA